MVDARALCADAKKRLAGAGLTAPNEFNVLFSSAVGKSYPLAVADGGVPPEAAARFGELLARRLAGEPLQYIAGSWPFLDFELLVGPGVLIPRDETQTAVETALGRLSPLAAPRAVDLCAGSGCIAFAIKRAIPGCSVTAVEHSGEACAWLLRNRARLGCDVEAVQADVFGFEASLPDGSCDVIVSNPPYLTPRELADNRAELGAEPPEAFLGGEDGLRFYRGIIPRYKDKLRPGGSMVFEIGASQGREVASLFSANGYADVELRRDMYGNMRVAAAKRPTE
ncbi:MAG: peptide chain release factor N(5)-glutamine methyltransferase [Oscillospiraceae bacterium]|nr:peptide chain release factor N(5)-glutamine methyltransferase [Oscillospiraceae bacterium]